MTEHEKLLEQLIRHEGLRLFPYEDTVGKLTIGIGRNLTDRGISREEALHLLENDIAEVESGLRSALPWISELDPVRQRVLLDMAFNLGVGGLLKFRKTLEMVRTGQFERASAAMLQSKWAKQVKSRALRLAKMMLSGQDPEI